MESIKLSTDEPYYRIIVEYLNLLFGNTVDSQKYWNEEIVESIQKTYFYRNEFPTPQLRNVKSQVNLPDMFKRLVHCLGIQMKPQFYTDLNFEQAFHLKAIVRESDVECMVPKVKVMKFLQYAEGFALYARAQCSKSTERYDLLHNALKEFSNFSYFIHLLCSIPLFILFTGFNFSVRFSNTVVKQLFSCW
jgi:hypothetical protein